MENSGQGYLVDLVVFAISVTLACTMLVGACSVEPETEVKSYASNLAWSTLLAFQHSTVEVAGGLTYQLGASPDWAQRERRLQHKTFAQLLVEDAFCNLRIEADGQEIAFGANRDFDESVREFIKSVLDELMGGRFGYRLTVRTESEVSPRIWVKFWTEIERLPDGGHQLCSETLVMNFPIPPEWFRNICDAESLGLGLTIPVEITLELWSK